MEPNTNNCSSISLPTSFSNINLKQEILDDEFVLENLSSSKGYLQDFPDLEQFQPPTSFLTWGSGIQASGFDPFASFSHGSITDFGLNRYKPYEENGSMFSAMQDFQAGGFLNFPNGKDLSIITKTASEYHGPKPLSIVAVPDESSCVTGDNFGYHNEDGSKRSKNIVHGNNNNAIESVSTKKFVRGRKKSKSAKGQWTAEEDR